MDLTKQELRDFCREKYSSLDGFYKEVYGLLETKYPTYHKITEPRKIYVPGGYPSIKWVPAHLFNSILEFNYPGVIPGEKPGTTSYNITLGLINSGVPIYFVSPQFAYACAATKLVDDFRLENLVWPRQNMVFAMPTKFMMDFCGVDLGFIYSGEFKQGITTCGNLIEVESKKHVIALNYQTWDDGRVGNFWGSYPKFGSIAQVIKDIPYQDYTDVTRETRIEEGELLNKVSSLIFKIVLILNCRGHLIETGLPAQIKVNKKDPNKTKTEYFYPNTIGFKYVYKRDKSQPTGAKRGVYTRMAFLRNQAYGPKYSLHKLIWIDEQICGGK